MHAADGRFSCRGKAERAYEHWQASYPQAADELQRLRGNEAPREALNAWRLRHPAAAKMHFRLILYSDEVVRKMRMTEPTWEPPDLEP
jgi:hypothetical protein